jgi:ABC-type multidrug transport system fused ATPase/permease subunit
MTIVPQHAFIQSGSIRMNITFSASHEETDEERMAQVVHACGLSEDLARLDDGIEYVYTPAQGS